jgi:hypothetical protein
VETDTTALKLETDTAAFGQVVSQEILNKERYSAN